MKKLLTLFLSESSRAVAVAFVSFFSAIFIFKLLTDFGFSPRLALAAVFLFNLTFAIFKFVTNFLAEELSLKRGLKESLLLGGCLLIVCLFFLVLASRQPIFLLLAASFMGLASGFYWFGYHADFFKNSAADSFGNNVGRAGVLRALLLLITPLLGGVLASLGGFPLLFIAALFFASLSLFFSFRLVEKRTHYDTSFQEVLKLLKRHYWAALAYTGNGMIGDAYAAAVPLVVYLSLGHEFSLGLFFFLSLFLVAIFNYLGGRWVNNRNKKMPLLIGSGLTSLVFSGWAFSVSPLVFLVSDIVFRIVEPLRNIPLEVLSYEKAVDGKSTSNAVLFQETAVSLGSIIFNLLMMILVLLGLPLQGVFIIAMGLGLLPSLVLRRRQVSNA